MKIKVNNNGCAEVAYADLSGKVLILPGESVLDIPDESVRPLITVMKRRAPQVFIEVIVDKPVPKPKAKEPERVKSKASKKAKKPDEKPDKTKTPSIDGGEK